MGGSFSIQVATAVPGSSGNLLVDELTEAWSKRRLDENKIKYTRTGRHRRLRVEDVLEFEERRERERRLGLKKLVEMSEDAGGYPELD